MSWNVNKSDRFIRDQLIAEADVLLLQELRLTPAIQTELLGLGFSHASAPTAASARPGTTVSAIFSRHRLDWVDAPSAYELAHLFSVARIGQIEVASCHIPNGSQYNLDDPTCKQRHLAAAAEWVHARPGRLLAGDFNEPMAFSEGRATSWAHDGGTYEPWRVSVDRLFNDGAVQHLCAGLHASPKPASWRSRGRPSRHPRWYDHAVWNGGPVEGSPQYLHDLNHAEKLSDHSPLVFDIPG